MENILTVNNLNKKYSGFELKNISFQIPKGSIVGFIGENGAGKTTTIKSILNLINIDSGMIEIFNKDYRKFEKMNKERIGVVLDNSFLSEQLSLKDVNRIMKYIYDNWDEQLFYDYVNRFNLPSDKIMKEYSTGMLMKLKIITALSHHPDLLILDEPTSGLDPIVRSEILDIFSDFIENKEHAIFISSHITSDLEHIADNIIFINNGEIVFNEEKDKLLNEYGLYNCDYEKYNKIDKNDYIKCKKNRNDYQLLINNIDMFKKKYRIKSVLKPSLEDIMLLYIRGE